MTSVAERSEAYQSTAARLIKSGLRHPFVMRMKPGVRNVLWTIKGAGTRNPPLPDRVQSVLFVCLGNICRSPFAAVLATRMLGERGRGDIRSASAGIRPTQAAGSPREAREVCAAYGLSLELHEPRGLTHELMESHDLVLVMEWSQRERLCATYPQYRDRIFLLPLFDDDAESAYDRYNIADPFGQTVSAYKQTYSRIERALRGCLANIVRARA